MLTIFERLPLPMVKVVVLGALAPIAHLFVGATARRNLETVLGDELTPRKRRQLARNVTRNFCRALYEYFGVLKQGSAFYADRIDDADARARVKVLEAASPRGFVGVTGHIGNWELLGHWAHRVGSRGMRAVVAKRLPNSLLNAHIERLRLRFGLETVYRDDPPTRPIRIMRDGHILGLVPDQDIKNIGGVFVDFLGRSAYTPTGPARLALAAGVPIVCAFFLRDGDRFRMIVCDPIVPDRSWPRNEELERLTRAWSAEVERAVRAHPEQWVWFHERWRTTPAKLTQRGRDEI